MSRIICIAILLTPVFVFGQGENNIWYFGGRGGLNFNQLPPQFDTSGQISGFTECSATLCDASGDLLFYANGTTIWNKNHEIMVNGNGLDGNSSTTQGVSIVPYPSRPNHYFAFFLDHAGLSGKLSFSVIDLTNNTGVVIDKNVFIAENLTEKMAVSKGDCGTVWLVVHERDSNRFLAYHITNEGINLTPVISDVGSSHNSRGSIVFNHDHTELAATVRGNLVELCDFDRQTGMFEKTLEIDLTVANQNQSSRPHSLCFSPNGKLLYVGQEIGISVSLLQFNLTLTTDLLVAQSGYLVEDYGASPGVGQIQIGADSVLYINGPDQNFVNIIAFPNRIGDQCGFNRNAIEIVKIEEGIFNHSLQNLVVIPDPIPELIQPFPKDTSICTSSFTLDATAPQAQYLWQDGSTDSTYTVTVPGIYWVERNVDDCTIRRDSITVTIDPSTYEQEMTLCPGDSIILGSQTITTQGTYTETFTRDDDLCDSTVVLTVSIGNSVDATDNETACEGDIVTWFDQVITSSGTYRDTAIQETGCDIHYTLNITFEPLPVTSDAVTLCEGDSLITHARVITISGIYEDTIPSLTGGCDTIHMIDVEVMAAPGGDTTYAEIAQGQTVEFKGTQYDSPGLYTVRTPSEVECDSIFYLSINLVEREEQSLLYIPNIFSPNGDGRNDVLTVHAPDPLAQYAMSVYDRWGQLIYESADPTSGWDGRMNGQEITSGVYIVCVAYIPEGQTLVQREVEAVTVVR